MSWTRRHALTLLYPWIRSFLKLIPLVLCLEMKFLTSSAYQDHVAAAINAANTTAAITSIVIGPTTTAASTAAASTATDVVEAVITM